MIEDKIEIGEYVRTYKGEIGKVYACNVRTYTDKKHRVSFYSYETNIGCESILKDYITKHSKDLKELVEEFDFVNGYPVRKINNELCNFDLNVMKWIPIVNIDDVGEILTHERYEANAFKVGEDDES